MAKNKKVLGKFQSDAFTNHMKTLLANIRFASLDEPIKTIVVTSSVMDEGKSTCSSNLACAMASSGKRTLIVDGDLRRRCLGGMLGMHNQNGIYSVLSGAASLRDAVSATHIPNLFFMDCETNVANPADIFATKRFEVLMEKLKQSFDYVVFDMPPIGLFVDAAVASNLADGTLLVVRQNHTKRDMVEKAIQQLNAAEANVLGIVMTFAEETKNDYYYSYYNSEGEKVSKRRGRRSEEPMAVADPTATINALADDNITDWMAQDSASFDPDPAPAPRQQPQQPQQPQPRATRGARPAQQAADPFAPGAFRNAGPAQGGASQARGGSRARHTR